MSETVTSRQPRLAVLMFTDVVGSTQIKSRLGVEAYLRLLRRHDELFRQALADAPGAEVLQDTGDGYFVAFANVTDAVRFALRFQQSLRAEPWDGAQPLRIRIGIHLGQLAVVEGNGRSKVVGMAADIASRLTSLAQGGQILLTRVVFDESRQFLREHPATSAADGNGLKLRWVAHGDYLFKGADEPMEVFEVGADGAAPLSPPADTENARRSVSLDQSQTLGWRPAIGLGVPQRPGWNLDRKLGEGNFGEVWLAVHQQLKQHRVFKFCFDADRLHSFKRELTFFRLLRDALGDRRDIAKLYDVRLDSPPFFLESEYAPGGNLIDWSAAQGGLESIGLETRLEIVAKICDAVAAAHSVGILHKDIKPGNILMHVDRDGTPRPRLSDFGIGLLFDRTHLAARHITESGFTMMPGHNESGRTGTQMYLPPESLAGRPFTTLGDIYALGVLLYQMTIADLDRPLALGWERGVSDELLRDDIAVCVDGDPVRRIKSAADIAIRLRRLDHRRAARKDELRLRDHARRRHRMLKFAAVALAFCALFSGLATVGYFRERGLRYTAELATADAAVEQGRALHLADQGERSRAAFTRGRAAYQNLGVSTLAADVGLYRSFQQFDAPLMTLVGHTKGVLGVAWMPDGRRVCSAAEDGTVRLWDAIGGYEIRAYKGRGGAFRAVAVSPDGKYILGGGKDGAFLWESETAKEVHPLEDPRHNEIRGVAFSPDGKLALTGSDRPGGSVVTWDVESGRQVQTYSSPADDSYYGVAFSPDGKRLLATTYQHAICVWAIDSAAPPLRLRGDRPHMSWVIGAAFSPPDGRRILSASEDQTLRLWDSYSGEMIRTFKEHKAAARAVAFAGARGEIAVSCSLDGTLKVWDVETAEVTRTYAGHRDGVRAIAVSPDRTRIASGGADNTVRIWKLYSEAEIPEVPTTEAGSRIISLGSSADGRLLVSGEETGLVTVLDAATLRPVRQLRGLAGWVATAQIVGAGRVFAADEGGGARVWDLASGRLLFRRDGTGHQPVENVFQDEKWCYSAASADGSIAIFAAPDRPIEVWSPESGSVSTLPPTKQPITCLAISPDGRFALAGDRSTHLYYWDLAAGRLVFSLPIGNDPARLRTLAFNRDGTQALIGGADNNVRLWDLPHQRELKVFAGHAGPVIGVGFGSEPGAQVSIGADRTLRLWNLDSDQSIVLSDRFTRLILAMAVLPDGQICCASGSVVWRWDLSRVADHLALESRLRTATRDLTPYQRDSISLRTLGEWYAFRGADNWAVECLEQARAGGAPVAPLMLARLDWQLDRRQEAAREFEDAIAVDRKLEPYLRLCMDAVAHPPTTHPATAPTTSRVVAR